MDEARGIVGISIPLIIGILAAEALKRVFPLFVFVCPAPLLAAALASALLLKRRKGGKGLLVLTFLLTGLFCGASPGMLPAGGFIRDLSTTLHGALLGRTRSMPFRSIESPSVIEALVCGERSTLSSGTVRVFREAGGMHILALSGLHLGIIYLIIKSLLSPLGNSPAAAGVKYFATLALSGLYVLAAGSPPSVVRAFLFIVLNESAALLHRSHSGGNVLLAALAIQAVLAPEVVTGAGFILSYLAMTGIVLVYPRLRSWYPQGKGFDPMHRLWDSAALSLSCQLFTAPAVLVLFGTFPKYFILTNLIAMPLTWAAVVLSVCGALLYPAGLWPVFLVRLDEWVVEALLYCLGVISRCP